MFCMHMDGHNAHVECFIPHTLYMMLRPYCSVTGIGVGCARRKGPLGGSMYLMRP